MMFVDEAQWHLSLLKFICLHVFESQCKKKSVVWRTIIQNVIGTVQLHTLKYIIAVELCKLTPAITANTVCSF